MRKGILLSTHELDLALQVADEVWLLQNPGPLHRGAPEDLVLDGVFEAVFEKEDVHFDRATGVFRIHPEGGRKIGLTGSGMAAFWTRRALQREGFAVVDAGEADAGGQPETSDRIILAENGGHPVWVLKTVAGSRAFDSIAALLEAMDHPHLP
jgi:iron complex transport system ATP-binding protein